jgi:aminoglycoside phosphotransferase (APT) family kinase protein
MRVTSTDRYLSVMLAAVQEKIIPELTSSDAQSSAQMIIATLTELRKREAGAAEILRSSVQDGASLLSEFVALNVVQAKSFGELPASHDDLIDLHATLTSDLAAACRRLSEIPVSRAVKDDILRRCAEWEHAYYTNKSLFEAPALHTEPSVKAPLTAESLESFLNDERAAPNGAVKVTKFQPLPGGFGKQTYLCEYTDADGEQDLVVRKTDPTPIMQHGGCNLENEFSLLSALSAVDFPAPKPELFCDEWQDIDGSFYTMPRAAGETPGSFLEGVAGDNPESLYLELAEWLGKLHSLPLGLFEDHIRTHNDPRILTGTASDAYRYNLEGWRKYIDEQDHLDSPLLIWLLDWLTNNIPNIGCPPVLVHGDYNVHNVLVENGAVSIILDWECADFGFAEQDLAYLKPNLEQVFDWSKFLAHYQAHGGVTSISEAAMRFGVAYAALRTNLAGNRGTLNLQTGRNTDLRYVMVELGFSESFMGGALHNTNLGTS